MPEFDIIFFQKHIQEQWVLALMDLTLFFQGMNF